MAMMTVCVLLLALCCLPLTSALGDTNSIASIKAPSEVTAATSFQAFFSGYFVSDTFDGAYAKYLRVYLAAEKEDVAPQFYNPDCYLIKEQTLCDPSITITSFPSNGTDIIKFENTPLNVTIPPTVGPSGKHYVLFVNIFESDGSAWKTTSLHSEVINLVGANATWDRFQEQGYTFEGQDTIPCGSLRCVQDCKVTEFDSDDNRGYEKCINGCPGVSWDFEGSKSRASQSTSTRSPTKSHAERPACSTPTETAVATQTETAIDARTSDPGASPSTAETPTPSTAGPVEPSGAASKEDSRTLLSMSLALVASSLIVGW